MRLPAARWPPAGHRQAGCSTALTAGPDTPGARASIRRVSETADVVVIGGGCNGASIAFHLAERCAPRRPPGEVGALASGPTGR
jgi:hypothetical protein